MRKKQFIVILACSSLAAGAISQMPPAAGGSLLPAAGFPTDSITADSAVVITPDSLLNRASESFKQLKWLKFEGEPDSAVYPMAWQTYEESLEAHKAFAGQPASPQWLRTRELLREIDGELLKGAFYYSSINDSPAMTRYARAFLDIQALDAFKGDTWENDPQILPMVAYIAASGAYNAREYDKAIGYFKTYLSTDDSRQRENVYMFMGQACLNDRQYDLGLSAMRDAITVYPANRQLPQIALKICEEGKRGEQMQEFLTHALALAPGDEELLNMQGKLYEDEGEYEKALNIYNHLDELHPNSMSTNKHIGLCYYNQGVNFFNQAITESSEKDAARQRRKSKNYFAAAADKFRMILASNPNAMKYLKMLGVCYLCMEEKENFQKTNEKLIIMGQDALDNVFMPGTVSYNDHGSTNFGRSDDVALNEAPSYSDFSRARITDALAKWVEKDEFETMDAYKARVNDQTIRNEYDRVNRECADEYLQTYGNKLRLNDIRLEPYDAANEVFKINTSYGPVFLHVPLKDNEAENFKNGWNAVRFKGARYFIDEDQVRLASITFMAANGKSYTYDNERSLNYTAPTDISIDFAAILKPAAMKDHRNNAGAGQQFVITHKSDVDENIPVSKRQAPRTIALILANENYTNSVGVQSALHDGETFADYCRLTLGIPEANIIHKRDAGLAVMMSAMSELQNKAEALNGASDIIVYYAGHGMPDESTKQSFLLPVDGDPQVSRTCYPLDQLYSELAQLKAESVMVFVDACFSGARRDGGMLTEKRAVAIKPKEAAPQGNMFVLCATSDNETASPFTEKNHGLFTYYLLKKLQESKGRVTLKELSDYVTDKVKYESSFNESIRKPQTPTATTSGQMTDRWRSKRLVQ